MTMDEDDSSRIESIKDKVSEIGQKVGDVSKKAARKTSEVSADLVDEIKVGAKKVSKSDFGQKVGEASVKAAQKTSQLGYSIAGEIKSGTKKVVEDVENKRDEIRERREKAKEAKIESDISRENELKRDMKTELFSVNTKIVEDNKKSPEILVPEEIPLDLSNMDNEGLKKELSKTINDVIQTLLISVIWAGFLAYSYSFTQTNPVDIGGLSLELFIWPVGTGIWGFYILHRLVRSRTFLSMPLGMRLQTSIGIGLATELAILLTSETQAITNIWGWIAMVALTVTLLSGMLRGLGSSFSRLLNFRKND
tara:strand:- start:729 stop:1655 length:927 start_codon:yes stop_codon:yes gene_type:complete